MGDESGGPDDEGGANPAFIHPGFGAAERIGSSGAGFVTIVGTNGDDGVVPEFGVVADAIEETGELFVHGVEDALIEGTFVAPPFVEGRPPGAVDVIGPEVDDEGFFVGLGFVDESESGIDEASGDLGALHPLEAFAEAFGVGPDSTGFFAGSLCEGKKLWSHAFEIGEALIEAVVGDGRGVIDVTLPSHVPFPKMTGGVSGFLELAGESGGFGVKPLSHPALDVIAPVVEVRGDAPAVRILSGGESDAGRGADGGVDVEVGELDPFRGESVDVLGVHLSSEAGEVGVAHVIDEDDNDVGFGG